MYFITSNTHKFNEAKAILPELEQLNLDLAEIQELDPHKIIEAKLHEARKHHKGDFVVEDTSLTMESLGDLPGPFVKWFLQALGTQGLVDLAEKLGNNAEAITMIGYLHGDKITFFEGKIHGKIVPPRTTSNFGWDPIFLPDGHEKTFAEMTREEKHAISMRGQAFRKLKEHIEK